MDIKMGKVLAPVKTPNTNTTQVPNGWDTNDLSQATAQTTLAEASQMTQEAMGCQWLLTIESCFMVLYFLLLLLFLLLYLVAVASKVFAQEYTGWLQQNIVGISTNKCSGIR